MARAGLAARHAAIVVLCARAALAQVTATDTGLTSTPCHRAQGAAIVCSAPGGLACIGQPVTLSAMVAEGTPPFRYLWVKDGQVVAGATDATLVIGAADPAAHAGSYVVSVRASCDPRVGAAATSPPLQLEVLAPPVSVQIQVQPSTTVCAGGNVQFTAVPGGGDGPFTFQWFRDGEPLSGTGAALLALAAVDAMDAGTYTVEVAGPCGSALSPGVALDVNEAPELQMQPAHQSVLPGGAAVLAVAATGTPPITFQWRKDGIPIAGANGAVLDIQAAGPATEGLYDCVVSNDCSVVTSDVAVVHVMSLEAPVHYPVGPGPADLLAMDLSNPLDGLPDIAVANEAGNSVSLRFNDGTGGFGPVATVALQPLDQPRALAAGDLIGDDAIDLAVACTGKGLVRFLDGGAGFTPSFLEVLAVPAGWARPVDLAAGDLDGSAGSDLVVACEGQPFGGGGGGLARSHDGGGFVPLPAPAGGFRAVTSVVLSDLDADGDLDVAAASGGSLGQPNATENVLLYANQGDGVYALAGALSAQGNPRALCAGDLDGDGRKDLAVTVESTPLPVSGGLIVFVQDGSDGLSAGSFHTVGLLPAGLSPRAVVCGDLGGDEPGSAEDVVTANFGSGDLRLLAGFDGAGFPGGSAAVSAGTNPSALALVDVDGDGYCDVLAANASSADVSVLRAHPPALGVAASSCGPDAPRIVARWSQAGALDLRLHGRPRASLHLLGGAPEPQSRAAVPAPCQVLPRPALLCCVQLDARGEAWVRLPSSRWALSLQAIDLAIPAISAPLRLRHP